MFAPLPTKGGSLVIPDHYSGGETMIWYFESNRGCGLRELPARTKTTAYRKLLKETGTYDPPRNVRVASKDDIAWVGGMGGAVPAHRR